MILSKTGSLYQQPNLFRFFLSKSSVLEYELKTHISDVLIDAYNKKKFKLQKLNIEILNCYQRYLLTLCDIRLVPEWQKRE